MLPGPYSAAVERVVDGDTLRARVAVWLGQELTVLVRIRGIDAPEIHGRCEGETARARDAKAALERLVSDGPVVLTHIEGGKYFGRVIADVTAKSGEDVGAALIAGGFARPYDGGARQPWCEVGLLDPRGDGEHASASRRALKAAFRQRSRPSRRFRGKRLSIQAEDADVACPSGCRHDRPRRDPRRG